MARGTGTQKGSRTRVTGPARYAVAADLTCSTAARGNLSMLDIHHRPRKRDASETGVRRCIGFLFCLRPITCVRVCVVCETQVRACGFVGLVSRGTPLSLWSPRAYTQVPYARFRWTERQCGKPGYWQSPHRALQRVESIEHNEVPRAAVESQEVGRDRSVAQAQMRVRRPP